MPTAAVVIIGDEILSGKFPDANGPYLIGRFRELGCDLHRMVTIGDQVADIAAEVAQCAARWDHVITTGGVGPTHDDRTLEGVAAAFDVGLRLHPALEGLLERWGLDRTTENLRMATLPEGAVLVEARASALPVIRMRNVWIFPGVPRLMQSNFEAVSAHFRGIPTRCIRLYCTQRETEMAGVLGEVQHRWPAVDIGSYPRFDAVGFRVIITLESRDHGALDAAEADLRGRLSLVDPPPEDAAT